MSAVPAKLVLFLTILDLGIALGAGLYETRIELPRWLEGSEAAGYRWNRAEAARADVGRRFWGMVTTGPLTLLTLAGLVLLWKAPEPARSWWLAATVLVLAERAMTFGYFIPAMLRLLAEDRYTAVEAASRALTWSRAGYLRLALTLAGMAAALQAFAWIHARPGGR